jgi:lysophospholipase L1-like esterase
MKKLSLYGDSVTASHNYPALMMARQPTKFSCVTDYSRGGNQFNANLSGVMPDGFQLFGGLTFAQHVTTVDTSDIVVLRLGGNSIPAGWVNGDPQASLCADYLDIGGEIASHIYHIRTAGKLAILVGTPYGNIAKMVATLGLTEAQATSFLDRTRAVNTSIRHVAAFYGVPFIATHGWGGNGGHPVADYSSTTDGGHPTTAYADAVAEYLADEVVRLGGPW